MEKLTIDSTIYSSKPIEGSRLEKEMKTYRLLEQLGISYLRVDHEPADTIEDCKEIEAILGVKIYKNLFLCNRQKTQFYLLVMPGDKKFVTKEVSKQIGSSRLSFGNAQHMEKYLNTTPGSASILGLMNDKEHKVHLLLDRQVTESEYFGCHPCINTSSLKIQTKDILEKFLRYTGHQPCIIEL
ncbi:prolyl-tRNA synthetase associated domain-containing protein [Garciella nitratireducens]|uniref:Ala-tRNA(Pro) deacylase n=1 Tax=Garciella nitratireducens DSM 15102 TaxID=1121911 RepID=A0A1T4KZ70_9FIRM|nr:prolyl-tRNA synthetase associated domain-containing protein [Garciella nitratireducens]SJZ47607.1 Ala-tRNA(Pro) deacylase [Garciella nitratireducens DSM 15102]